MTLPKTEKQSSESYQHESRRESEDKSHLGATCGDSCRQVVASSQPTRHGTASVQLVDATIIRGIPKLQLFTRALVPRLLYTNLECISTEACAVPHAWHWDFGCNRPSLDGSVGVRTSILRSVLRCEWSVDCFLRRRNRLLPRVQYQPICTLHFDTERYCQDRYSSGYAPNPCARDEAQS